MNKAGTLGPGANLAMRQAEPCLDRGASGIYFSYRTIAAILKSKTAGLNCF